MTEPNGSRPPRPRRLSRNALKQLRQPLDPDLVSERTSEDGDVLRYLEGWRVIEQANTVFGHNHWGAELVGEVAYRTLPASGRGRNAPGLYTATVRVTVDGSLPHSDVGNSAVSEQTPEGHAVAHKAAVTDALKRALRHYGDQFGNRLSAGFDELPLLEANAPPEALRRQLLEIAASAGSEESTTREWVSTRYGCTLEQLEGRPLADAVGRITAGLDRRNGNTRAA
jgi:DNA recombination protein Rad52